MNNTVLIFTDNYPYGKSETFLETELKYIYQSFDKVSVLPLETEREKNIRDISEKTEIIKPVFYDVKKKTELLIKGLFNSSIICRLLKEGLSSNVWKSWTKFRIWFTHFLMIRSLLSEIKERDMISFFNKFDILYFYWGLRWSQILPFLPPDLKPKTVVRFHGSDLYEHTNGNYIPFRIQQLERTDLAVTISLTGMKYLLDHYPFMEGKTIISRIGTNDSGVNPFITSDIIRIVSCSNLVAVKRVHLIANTLALIKKPVMWIHFGDGPDRKKVEAIISRLPSNINIRLAGSVNHEEIMSYYRTESVDIFLNTSSSEGIPVSVMEAMSFGIPVIATDVGGTAEIVTHETGVLLKADFTTHELASEIEKMKERPDYLNLRHRAREAWAEKLDAEKVFPGFISSLTNI